MRRVVVTGANRGLGLEFARQLLAAGDEVVATARTPKTADALNKLVSTSGGRGTVVRLDVARPGRGGRRRACTSASGSTRSTCWSTTPESGAPPASRSG